MSVTCRFDGRLGNIVFSMAIVIAYCKKHNLQYWFPNHAWACIDGKVPIQVANTGEQPINPQIHQEPTIDGHPYYYDIPYMDNVEFRGYYQSFRYFDDYRQDILETFNLPWVMESGIVGIHIRLGDCIGQEQAFPVAPKEYYDKAIQMMIDKGYSHFKVYSDTPVMAREQFLSSFPDCIFDYREGYTGIEDFISLSQCEHIITARSTFSLMAGWFNRNPDKVVLCPEGSYWWHKQNLNLLDSPFITQVHWQTQTV